MMKKLLILLAIPMLFFSCEEEPPVPVIDAEISAFIQKFVDEGTQRGVSLNSEELEAFLVNDFSQNVGAGGFCAYGWWNYPGRGTPRVEIRKTDPCWNQRTDLEKENLVYHELGHALLSRNHINETLPNGTSFKSIMCGDGLCSNYGTFFASGPLREYYIDELFDDQTPFPSSFLNKQFDRIVFEEDFENYTDQWDIVHLKDEGSPEQYEISLDTMGIGPGNIRSLAISNQANITDSAQVIVLKRFDISNYGDCSNLVARANIRTEGLTDGSFSMATSLRERDANGDLTRFFIDVKKQETFAGNSNAFEDFEMEIYCLPENTDVVTISFRIYSPSPATVFIEDVVLELRK